MEELTGYAKQKSVGVILWVLWNKLDDQLEKALDHTRMGRQGRQVDSCSAAIKS